MWHGTNDIHAWLAAYDGLPYDVIYADPPWCYDNGGVPQGACPYPTMDTAALCALPVSRIAARDSLLFCWATCPMLPDALNVLRAWGYTYRTVAFVWVKTYENGGIYSGLGYYSNMNAEMVLLGRRGRGVPRCARNIKQIVMAPRSEHSTKPTEVRHRIDRLVGAARKIELFARHDPPGWDAVGNGIYRLQQVPEGQYSLWTEGTA